MEEKKRKEKGRKIKKQNKGITLVALVITIIIIIILATVTINMAFGDNGLIKQAQLAKDMAANSTVAEQEGMNSLMDEYANLMIEDEEKEEPNTVETILGEGDYVNYVDRQGITRKCVVLYGPENTNYLSYGIQIIAMETMEEVILGNGTGEKDDNGQFVADYDDENNFNIAEDSYNSAISILNERAEKYLNTTYVNAARCVGSVPENPNSEAITYYTREDSWFADFNGVFKEADENYLTDYNQMDNLGIKDIDANYWSASRYIYVTSDFSGFGIRHVNENGYDGHRLCGILSNGRKESYGPAMGLRPVFTLKSGIKVTEGNGTENEPYTLGV